MSPETKRIVVERIREEQEIRKNVMEVEMEGEEEEEEATNTADVILLNNSSADEEYERWKARIKRAREAREAIMLKKEMANRVWERKNTRRPDVACNLKRSFNQYIHKSGYFQVKADPPDQAGSATPDFSRPRDEDEDEDDMGKTVLPKASKMRTKSTTHLANQDTTRWMSYDHDDPLPGKYIEKMAPMNKPLQKPKTSTYEEAQAGLGFNPEY